MKKNNKSVCGLCGKESDKNNGEAVIIPLCEERRRRVLNLFLEDNPAFEVRLRHLQDRELPDNDRIALKAYEDEPLAPQIKRHCLNLQSVLFTLSVFPEVKIPDEVLDGFFEMAGELIYVLHHLAEGVGDDAGMGTPGLRCAPSGLRNEADFVVEEEMGEDADFALARRQRVPALALLRLLRGDS
ncbi:MAG TPA: hypothetical protein ENJ08_15340 [Gammaproteobacteria bacterium]|nr:hypothetical protein [Gammaproteobacteria bacterium]